MKILFVVPHYYPMIGGVESYVQTLAAGLKKEHEVVIVTSGNKTETTTHQGIKIYHLPYRLRLSNTPMGLLWYFRLRRIVKRERPDLINAHSPVPYMADMAQLARRGTPFVATYHSGSMVKGKGGIVDTVLKVYERWLLPGLFNKARAVIAIDQPFAKKHTDSPSKVAFIPPGIDTELFKPQPTKKTVDVTFVGRIEHTSEWKGLDVLLKAVAHNPQVSLRVIGDGDAIEYYRQMTDELGIEKNVTFTGPLRGEELANAYRSSRIVVLPSKTESESFGMVLAEAQACGVAVIGSRIGGIPNVILEGKTGLLVPPNQPKSLATAIAGLLEEKERCKAYGEAGVHHAREAFSQVHLIQATDELFKKVVKTRIVHVASNYPPRLGGLENVVKELAVQQHLDGRDVRVITSRLGYSSEYQDDVPVTHLRAIEIAHTPLMPGLLGQLLKIQRGDIVHVHVAQAFVPEMVRFASRLKGFRYVAHVHLDVAPSGPAGLLLKVYKPLLLGPMLRGAQYTIVFTEEQRQQMIRKYRLQSSRVVIVPNGVAERFYHTLPRSLHRTPRLLFVGRLSLQKNLPLLLNALDGISSQFDTRIVGDGELRDEYEALTRRLKLKNVHFHGRQDGDDLRRQYQEADIFVLPSEREGMPLVLLEAMAAALPIVGTDVTGIRDVVVDGKTGRLVPFGDVEAFRSAITEVTEDAKTYHTMSQAALEEAGQYSWSVVSRRFEKLYEA